MIKQLRMKSLLLLCALIVGSLGAWAQAPVNTVLWSEDFSGYSANAVPNGSTADSHTGTTVYEGGSVSYSCTLAGTKIFTNGGPNNNHNILVAKGNGTFTVSGIPTGEAKELTLSYKTSGSGTLEVSTSTGGAAISGSTITTGSASTIILTFKNTDSSNNLRLDDVSVKVKTAGTSGGSSVAAPTFSVAEGAIAAGTTITLSTETVGADIYYTLDETTPSSSSTKYTTGITVTKPVTIKAIAIDDSEEESAVSSATYTISVETPTFSEKAGKVDEGTILTITASPSLTIIYTIDGSTPSWESSNGEIYSEPLVLNDPVTVKAVAVDDYENESSVKSASYTISYDGGVDIIPNFTFFGKNASYSETTYSEVSGTQDGVTVTHSKGTGENTYASASAMRFYLGNTLTIEAPAGKVITKIVLIQSNAEADNISSSPIGYNQTNHTWAGKAESVVFTRPKEGAYMQFSQISVVLANKVTLASACTDGSKFYGTYSSSKALKVPADLTISEIKVEDEKLVVVPYATGEVIPANTGVMIVSTTSGEHTIAIAKDGAGTSKLGAENMLKASGDAGIDAATMNEANKLFYRLTMHKGTDLGFYWGAADGAAFSIAANKAYLAVPKTAGARIAGFNLFENEGEATAIEGVKTIGTDAPVFNLNGQRVNSNAKGLLIKNGKKFMNR